MQQAYFIVWVMQLWKKLNIFCALSLLAEVFDVWKWHGDLRKQGWKHVALLWNVR